MKDELGRTSPRMYCGDLLERLAGASEFFIQFYGLKYTLAYACLYDIYDIYGPQYVVS
jgi:hypothetical protein